MNCTNHDCNNLHIGHRVKVVPIDKTGVVKGIDTLRKTVLVKLDDEDYNFSNTRYAIHNAGEWKYGNVAHIDKI